MAETDGVCIVHGARTPVGSFLGSLRVVPAHELGAVAVRGALDRAGVEGADIGEETDHGGLPRSSGDSTRVHLVSRFGQHQ